MMYPSYPPNGYGRTFVLYGRLPESGATPTPPAGPGVANLVVFQQNGPPAKGNTVPTLLELDALIAELRAAGIEGPITIYGDPQFSVDGSCHLAGAMDYGETILTSSPGDAIFGSVDFPGAPVFTLNDNATFDVLPIFETTVNSISDAAVVAVQTSRQPATVRGYAFLTCTSTPMAHFAPSSTINVSQFASVTDDGGSDVFAMNGAGEGSLLFVGVSDEATFTYAAFSTSGAGGQLFTLYSPSVIQIDTPDVTQNFDQQWVIRGATGSRPSLTSSTGFPYFDTTLGIPIWRRNPVWIDATGTPV